MEKGKRKEKKGGESGEREANFSSGGGGERGVLWKYQGEVERKEVEKREFYRKRVICPVGSCRGNFGGRDRIPVGVSRTGKTGKPVDNKKRCAGKSGGGQPQFGREKGEK